MGLFGSDLFWSVLICSVLFCSVLMVAVHCCFSSLFLCLCVVLRYNRYHYKSLSSKSLGNSPSNMQQYVFIYRWDAAPPSTHRHTCTHLDTPVHTWTHLYAPGHTCTVPQSCFMNEKTSETFLHNSAFSWTTEEKQTRNPSARVRGVSHIFSNQFLILWLGLSSWENDQVKFFHFGSSSSFIPLPSEPRLLSKQGRDGECDGSASVPEGKFLRQRAVRRCVPKRQNRSVDTKHTVTDPPGASCRLIVFFLSCSYQEVYSGSSAHWTQSGCRGDRPALRRLRGSQQQMEQHGEEKGFDRKDVTFMKWSPVPLQLQSAEQNLEVRSRSLLQSGWSTGGKRNELFNPTSYKDISELWSHRIRTESDETPGGLDLPPPSPVTPDTTPRTSCGSLPLVSSYLCSVSPHLWPRLI